MGKINTCPRCGDHLKRESGFWRCENEKCRHVINYGRGFDRYGSSSFHQGTGEEKTIPSYSRELYNCYNGNFRKRVRAGEPEPVDAFMARSNGYDE